MLRRRRVGSRVLVSSGRKRSPRRFGLLAASAIVALTALGTLPGAAADGTSSRTVIASADAYVTSSEPSANFGSATDLRIDSAPNDKSQARINRSYIRFDIPPSSEPPVSATLRLYATGGDKNGVTVGVASNDWDEPTITWDNTPSSSASPTVASGPFDAGAWVSLDVTALIPAAGPVTLALTSSAPAPMAFASREQGGTAPSLSIETAAAVVTAPANETAPSISGLAQEGQTLTATPGTWSGTQPITKVFQWLRCNRTAGSCVVIAGANNTTYTLTGDDVGNTLLVGVTASNSAGSSDAASAPTSIVVAAPNDTSPPAAPTGLSASGDQSSLTLAWDASSDNVAVAGYDVSLNGSGVNSVSQTSYRFGGLSCGTSYTLGVAALDAAGNHSTVSTLTTATAACSTDTIPPAAPTGLSASGDQSSLTLAWDASSDNVAVAGYDVSLNGSGVNSVSQTSYRFTGLSCGTSYTLGVAAFDAAGNGSTVSTLTTATAACSTDTIPPAAPTGLSASGDQSSLTLAWDASSDNVAVAGYDVSLNGSGVNSVSQTSYRFTGLSCGTSYTLGVAAFDAAGNGSTVSTLTTATATCPDTTPPSAPSNLQVSASDQSSLTLAWDASSDNVAVAGYDVSLNGSGVNSVSQTSYRFTGLSCGTSYTLGVAAFDAAGNGSTVSTLTTATATCPDTTPPSAPSNLQVSASDQSSLTLTWDASSDNVAVAGYDVSLNGSGVNSVSQTSYRFTGLSCGTSYTLGVAAFDAAGNGSTVSTLTTATAPCPTGPLNPCGTVVTPPATYQHVVWIVFENKPDSAIIGSASAPYTNTLASRVRRCDQLLRGDTPEPAELHRHDVGLYSRHHRRRGSVVTSVGCSLDLLPSAELAVAPGIHAVELRPDRLLSVCGQAQPGRVLHGHQDGLRIARRTAWRRRRISAPHTRL